MKVLVVDDEKNIRESIEKFLGLEDIQVMQASNGVNGQAALKEYIFDAALIDLKMPGMNGMELLTWIRTEGPDIPVIMMSAFGEIEDAVNAMKNGARDYIVKPFNPEELVIRLKRIVIDDSNAKIVQKKPSIGISEGFIGKSAAIEKIRKIIEKVSHAPSSVLITGESGTGKEVTANLIHVLSPRSAKPFVPVNLGGIPDTLMESELFGYEKGAFTGADSRRIGFFEAGNGGTLFLDEIGEMPLALQVKLLRVLQERKIVRLGSTLQIPVDVKVIAATNRILEDEIKAGRFREDLYYRLNVVKIELPPLRERGEDIRDLALHFVKQFNVRFGRKITGFTDDAMTELMSYSYPGNIRELENIIERAFIFCEGEEIAASDLSLSQKGSGTSSYNGELTMKEGEKQLIIKALVLCNGNRTKAALELGISRRSLLYKIKEYGI